VKENDTLYMEGNIYYALPSKQTLGTMLFPFYITGKKFRKARRIARELTPQK
jgi:hypothetical protein